MTTIRQRRRMFSRAALMLALMMLTTAQTAWADNIANCEIRGTLEGFEDGYGPYNSLTANVQVWYGETQLVYNTDYDIEVEYVESYEVGQTYNATIVGRGDWSGSQGFTFTFVVPHHTVVFVANGGTGTMADDIVGNDNHIYYLPECGFTAPPYWTFDHWEVSCEPGEEKQPGDYFTAPYIYQPSDIQTITVTAIWAGLVQDGDGNFLIGNAADLYYFAEIVNGGNASANAKLTADIVVNENVLDANGDANTGDFVQWTPIGNDYDATYSGTFDGQGHTISGLYVSGSGWNVGLIGLASGTAVVKNLGIVDSYFSSSNNMLGSIVGGVSDGSSVTLANVYSTSTVTGDNWIGGLVGGDGSGSVTIINSYFAGKTSAGWSYGSHHDDLVSGDFDMPISGTLNVVNAFVLGTSNHGTAATAAQLADGTVAAALHYYQDALADGTIWGISDGKTGFAGTIDGVSVTTADITLHTFDGDATTYSSKYIVGKTTPLPMNVVRDGYTFFGWYDNADLEGDAVTQISSSATGDKEYWAKFERSHAVSFVLDGGTIQSGAIDHYIEGEMTMLPTMVFKDGASFEGWYTTTDFTGSRYYSIPATATEDMTFYAKWGAEKTTFYLQQGGSPEPVNILYEGENIVWLDANEFGYYVQDNSGNMWGGFESSINVPYTGGESTFGNGDRAFYVSQSGFYLFTLTDKGDGNWFISVLHPSVNYCTVSGIWQAISTPVHDDGQSYESIANVDNLTDGTYDLFRYDEASGTWKNQKSSSGATGFSSLEPGRGYIYRRSSAETLTFVGLPNSADSYSVRLTANGTSDLKGFNLVGNPYPFKVRLNREFYALGADGTWQNHSAGDSLAVGQGALVHTDGGETLTFYASTRSTNASSKGLPPLPKGLCLGGGCEGDAPDAGGTPALRFAYIDGGQLVVTGEGTLQAYDMMGRLLLRREMKNEELRMKNSDFPGTGVYILRLGEKTQKIVIR